MGRSTAPRAVALVAIFCALAAGGCNDTGGTTKNASSGSSSGGKKRIVLLINTPSSYWETGRKGMELAEDELKLKDAGFEAVFQGNDQKEQGQIDLLRQLETQPDIVGVAISPVKADILAIADEMRNLQKKGVHVICMDGDIDRTKYRDAREAYIGTDNSKAGEVLGDAAKHLLDDRKAAKGGYVDFVGFRNAQNAIDRMDGIKKTLGGSYKELARMEDGTDKQVAKANVRKAFENFPDDLQALVGIWSYNAPLIGDVVGREHADRRSSLTVATFDCEAGAIDEMSKGNIDVMVVQNPYDICYQSVRMLAALAKDDKATVKKMFPNLGKEGGDIYDTDIRVVVPEKSPLNADVFTQYGPKVQFFTLPKFQDWLKQRGLTGS